MLWMVALGSAMKSSYHERRIDLYNTYLQSDDIEFVWSSLKNMIYTGMNLFITKVRIRRHQFLHWFTSEHPPSEKEYLNTQPLVNLTNFPCLLRTLFIAKF